MAAELARRGFELLLLTLDAERLEELCAGLWREMAELDDGCGGRPQVAQVVHHQERVVIDAEPGIVPGEETHQLGQRLVLDLTLAGRWSTSAAVAPDRPESGATRSFWISSARRRARSVCWKASRLRLTEPAERLGEELVG